MGAALAFVGEAAALSDTPDVHVPETNGRVWAIVQSGNTVYVGGEFTQIGGVARKHIAAFDATTGLVDPAWDPDMNGTVRALAVLGDKVYVGGSFWLEGGDRESVYNLTAFNLANGVDASAPDPAWDPGLDGTVYALVVFGDRLYAGGAFTEVNDGATSRNNLAAFNLADGSSAATVDPAWDPNMNHHVYTLVVSGDKVYAGGEFTTVNGGATTRNRLAAFNLADGIDTGMTDPAWDPNMNHFVYALAVSRGKLYAGGMFTEVNGGATVRNCLAAFNLADGTSAAAVDPVWNPDCFGGVTALAVSGRKLYAGGAFAYLDPPRCLAAFNLAGGSRAAIVDSWCPNANNWVFALAPSGSGGILAGGYFPTIGGNPRSYLAGFGAGELMPLGWISVAAVMLVVALLVVVRRKARSAQIDA